MYIKSQPEEKCRMSALRNNITHRPTQTDQQKMPSGMEAVVHISVILMEPLPPTPCPLVTVAPITEQKCMP